MLGIRVVSLNGAALAAPLAASFGDAGGDIGRGVDCTLVLADPERRISRRQAMIACRGGRHFIRQIGTNLAVELDGVPLALDVDYPLEPGAQIRIGPYLLLVDDAARAPLAPPPAAAGDLLAAFSAQFNPKKRPPRASVFGDLLDDASNTPPAPSGLQELDLVIGDPTGANERPAAPPDLPTPASATQLVEALYAGLGLPAPGDVSAPQLKLIGALLRRSVEGTLELLAARAIAKRELGASPTLLQTRENNPLKFSPDADAALAHLLGPVQRGFVAPLAAMADAFGDLRAHELAVLSGMRAALDEVLARFDPAALEQQLTPKGRWDNLLPGSREAKLWEHYGERYAQMMREVEDDFDSLFGRAFRQAYETQLAELARAEPLSRAPGRSEAG